MELPLREFHALSSVCLVLKLARCTAREHCLIIEVLHTHFRIILVQTLINSKLLTLNHLVLHNRCGKDNNALP